MDRKKLYTAINSLSPNHAYLKTLYSYFYAQKHETIKQNIVGDIPNVVLTQIIGGHAPLGFSAHAERDNGTMNLISVGVGY